LQSRSRITGAAQDQPVRQYLIRDKTGKNTRVANVPSTGKETTSRTVVDVIQQQFELLLYDLLRGHADITDRRPPPQSYAMANSLRGDSDQADTSINGDDVEVDGYDNNIVILPGQD